MVSFISSPFTRHEENITTVQETGRGNKTIWLAGRGRGDKKKARVGMIAKGF